MRVAILGTGGIARAHVKALHALADSGVEVELVGACDVDADRVEAFATEWSIPAFYTDLAAMLGRQRPQVIHICTPPGAHADLAIQCLLGGADVVCEKPPVLSIAEIEAVQAAELRTGRSYTTIFQHRFGSAGQHVRALISAGVLGAPRVAICHTLWFRTQEYYEVPWRGNWELEGGGPTLGLGVHQIDLLAYLLGEWDEVSATAVRLARDIDTEDVSMAHVSFSNGALASIVTSVLSPREESYIRLDFDDATVEVSHVYGYSDEQWTITPAKHVDADVAAGWALPGPDEPSSHVAQLRRVYAALADGTRPPGDSDSARATMELVTGIYAAAFTHVPVRRSDLTPGNPFHASLTGGATQPVPSEPGPRRSPSVNRST